MVLHTSALIYELWKYHIDLYLCFRVENLSDFPIPTIFQKYYHFEKLGTMMAKVSSWAKIKILIFGYDINYTYRAQYWIGFYSEYSSVFLKANHFKPCNSFTSNKHMQTFVYEICDR